MDVYPSNSHAKRKPVEKRVVPEPIVEEEPVRKILITPVTIRKQGLGSKFKEIFLSVDAKTVFTHVAIDVMFPAIRDTIVEMGTQTLERIFYGESRTSRRPASRPTGSGVYQNYSRYAQPREDPREREREHETRRRKTNYRDIVIATRSEAQDIVDEMFRKLKSYGTVSLMDLYEMLEVTGDYTDEGWGWKNLRGADIRRVHGGGYTLMLPELELLN